MINISMSLLNDYMKCPRMAEYRILDSLAEKRVAIPSDEMMWGTVAHYVIEKYWDNRDKALGSISDAMAMTNVTTGEKYITECVENFFKMFPKNFFSKDDEIEKLFKVKTKYKDVFYVGKFDRIHDGTVYDWKTGKNPPENLNYSPQFIFYHLCYKKLYKKFPASVVYVGLKPMQLYYYTPLKEVIDEFENVLIPSVISAIKRGDFPASGLFGYHVCEGPRTRCVFKDTCWNDIGIK